ncbi:hypothetical protein K1T71_002116, partial [Dendrolimus kikuchii]
PGSVGHERGYGVSAAGQRAGHHERQAGGPGDELLRATGYTCRCYWRCSGRAPMRHPSGDVHSIPNAQEGRGLVRARRAEKKPRGSFVREGAQQSGVLRVRRLRTNHATCLLVGVSEDTDRSAVCRLPPKLGSAAVVGQLVYKWGEMLSLHPHILRSHNMASKLVLVVALLAGSQASPALLNGVFYRDGRAYAIGQASGSGLTQSTSRINGDVAQSYGSSNGGFQLARDGLYYSSPAFVQTQAYDGNVPIIPGEAKAIAPGQGASYYNVPAPATIVSYQKFAAPPVVNYEVPAGAVSALSRATSDGNDDSSISTVHSSGSGIAISDAQTSGVTSTHAKSSGYGYGNAVSTNKFNHETASTSAKTSGAGSVETSAKSNGRFSPVVPAPVPVGEIQPAVIDAKNQYYVPKLAAVAAPVAAAKSLQKPISWRFGTFYDVPSSSANAQVNSGANGYAKTYANTANQGVATANANLFNGYGALKSTSVETSYGISNVNADASSGAANNAKSSANINGRGNASTSANTNAAGSSSRSTANTNGAYGFSRTNADANASGSGSAKSSAYGGSSKRADSSVSSYGYGSAKANAQSV